MRLFAVFRERKHKNSIALWNVWLRGRPFADAVTTSFLSGAMCGSADGLGCGLVAARGPSAEVVYSLLGIVYTAAGYPLFFSLHLRK